jgi:hypothetical protein
MVMTGGNVVVQIAFTRDDSLARNRASSQETTTALAFASHAEQSNRTTGTRLLSGTGDGWPYGWYGSQVVGPLWVGSGWSASERRLREAAVAAASSALAFVATGARMKADHDVSSQWSFVFLGVATPSAPAVG